MTVTTDCIIAYRIRFTWEQTAQKHVVSLLIKVCSEYMLSIGYYDNVIPEKIKQISIKYICVK